MREYLIGTGGWEYFHIPGLNSLVAYSRIFNFVEVNSTFYEIPPIEKARKWRRLVPADFQFAVRANKAITHEGRFHPTKNAFEAFERLRQICAVLGADIIHFQTPLSFKLTKVAISNIRTLISSFAGGKMRFALEPRQATSSKLPKELVKMMQEKNMIHCVDLSKGEAPAFTSDTLYTRLFGKGEHNVYQPTDAELVKVDAKASRGNFEKVVMSFHFVKMYTDAVRLKIYRDTGKFPMVTHSTGIESFEEVLQQDSHFPTTKEELTKSQGWKLFDLNKNKRVRVDRVLEGLPSRVYGSMHEVIQASRDRIGERND